MKKKIKGGITGKGFKPGKSGNPSGRPKSAKIIETLKKIGNEPYNEDYTKLEYICKMVVENALDGHLQWAKLYFERVEGKPFLNHSISVDKSNDQPIKVFDIEGVNDDGNYKTLALKDKDK